MRWEDFRVHKRLILNPVVGEEVYTIIGEIDGVKNSWLSILSKMGTEGLVG